MIRELILLAIVAGCVAGCGRKSDPVPPAPADDQAPTLDGVEETDENQDISALEAIDETRAT